MDYKHAPGRNWTRERRRGPRVQLRPHTDAERTAPSSVWYTAAGLKHAAGRNWSHEPLPRRYGLDRARPAPAVDPSHPPRERGGGDHDQPYEYRRPSARWTFPFTEREYARLLLLKSKVSERANTLT
jgi:hypothetical protein